MFSKSILAVAALASTLSLAAVAPAKADPSISFGIGFSSDPWTPDYGPGPFVPHHPPRPMGFGEVGFGDAGFGYDGGWHRPGMRYRISCGQGASLARARGFHGVRAVDCSAPVYEYRGWKFGQPYNIQVSMRGRIVGASPAYW